MAPADLAEELKKSSSKWIKTKGSHYRDFYWQEGYGGFSVGWSQVDSVKKVYPGSEGSSFKGFIY
jgi:hypothetical protein